MGKKIIIYDGCKHEHPPAWVLALEDANFDTALVSTVEETISRIDEADMILARHRKGQRMLGADALIRVIKRIRPELPCIGIILNPTDSPLLAGADEFYCVTDNYNELINKVARLIKSTVALIPSS